MKSLTIRVNADLHKEIKIKATLEGLSIQEYIIRLVQKDLEKSDSNTK